MRQDVEAIFLEDFVILFFFFFSAVCRCFFCTHTQTSKHTNTPPEQPAVMFVLGGSR